MRAVAEAVGRPLARLRRASLVDNAAAVRAAADAFDAATRHSEQAKRLIASAMLDEPLSLVEEIRALRAEVAALKQPMEQTAAATTQQAEQAEQFDNATAGGNAMATEDLSTLYLVPKAALWASDAQALTAGSQHVDERTHDLLEQAKERKWANFVRDVRSAIAEIDRSPDASASAS